MARIAAVSEGSLPLVKVSPVSFRESVRSRRVVRTTAYQRVGIDS